ncbi:MAG: cupin domain-containing protein [Acidobacteriota bacterium]|nr:cupin domain-containing protein [Acidobacteriota bacterium]
MSDVTRRDVCAGLSALALTGAGTALGAAAMQVHATEAPAVKTVQPARPVDQTPDGPAGSSGRAVLEDARVFRLRDQPARTTRSGGESRSITHGRLSSGEWVNLHQTMQPAGAAPAPLHVIRHTEFILIREGEVEFDHDDSAGKTVSEGAGPGDVIFVASGTNHRLRSVGSGPASYVVVAIGGDAK